MFYIPQIQEDDCGFACLKMMLAKSFRDSSYLFIPNQKKKGPYSYKELIDIADKYGLIFQGIRFTDKNTITSFKFPLIVCLKDKNEAHAVILKSIRLKKVTIYDPSIGVCTLSKKEFMNSWDGTSLILKEKKNVSFHPHKLNFISKFEKIMIYVLEMISAVLGILGAFLFNNPDTEIISLILLGLFLLFEISLRLYSVLVMNKMDKRFDEYINIKTYRNKNLLKLYEQYKKSEITHSLNSLFNLAISIFLIIIITLNNPLNLIFVFTCLLFALLRSLYFTPLSQKKIREVSSLEKSLNEENDLFKYRRGIKYLHQKAYWYGMITLFAKYFVIVLIVISVYLTMKLSSFQSGSYIIFYGCISIYLFEQLSKVFSLSKQIEKYRKDKVTLINSMFDYNQNNG